MRDESSCRDWLVAQTSARLAREARADGHAVGLAGGRRVPSLARPFQFEWTSGFDEGLAERTRRLERGDEVPSADTIADGYWPLDFVPTRRLPSHSLGASARTPAEGSPADNPSSAYTPGARTESFSPILP